MSSPRAATSVATNNFSLPRGAGNARERWAGRAHDVCALDVEVGGGAGDTGGGRVRGLLGAELHGGQQNLYPSVSFVGVPPPPNSVTVDRGRRCPVDRAGSCA